MHEIKYEPFFEHIYHLLHNPVLLDVKHLTTK